MSSLKRRVRNWLLTTVAVLVIGLAVLLGLFRLAASQLPEYRAQLEARASEAAGLPVRFGSVDARLHFNGPELIIRDARVLDPETGQVLIRAQTGGVSLNFWSLIRDRSFNVSKIFLDGANLKIDRTSDGRFHIHGLDAGNVAGDAEFRLADLPKGLFELRRTTIGLEDQLSGVGPWTFSGVEIRLVNNGDLIELDGSVKLPKELGRSLTLKAELQNPGGEPADSRWEAHVDARQIDLQGWAELIPDRFRLVEEGSGDLALRVFAMGGELDHASVRADLSGLRIYQAPGSSASIPYEKLAGRFEFDRVDNGWTAAARDLQLDMSGHQWKPGEIEVNLRRDDSGLESVSQIDLRLDFVGLDQLSPLLGWMPDDAARERLLGLNPRGQIHNLDLAITRAADKVQAYRVAGEFSGLGVDADQGVPAVDGMNGRIDADESSGTLALASHSVAVDFPGVFRWPLQADRLAGDVAWTMEGDSVVVRSDGLEIERGPIRIVADAILQVAEGQSPELKLNAVLENAPLADIEPFLPVSIMSDNLTKWLDNALLSGTIPRADVVIDGPLNKFPFRDNEGVFTAEFPIEGLTLRYAEGWPDIENIEARAKFDKISLAVDVSSGDVLGNRARNAQVRFDNLDEAVMRLDVDVEGDLSNSWEYVRQSGLAKIFGDTTELLTMSGANSMSVDLTLPVRKPDQIEVDLELGITNGQVAIAGLNPAFSEINGSISVKNEVISGTGLNAVFMDHPVVIDVVPRVTTDHTYAVIRGAGQLNGPDLDRLGIPWADRASGTTAYRASATIPTRGGGNVQLQVLTDLEGLVFNWPAPLNKGLEPRDLRVDLEILPEDLMDLGIAYAPGINARLRLEHEPGQPWQVYTGMVTTDGEATLPEDQGLVVTGQIEATSLEDWLEAAGTGSSDEQQFDLRRLLREVRVSVGNAAAIGYQFGAVDLLMQRGVEGWQVQLDGEKINGHLGLPYALDSGAMVVELQRAYLIDPVEAVDADADDGDGTDPRNIPAADITVEDFRFSDMQLGKLSAVVDHVDDGVVIDQLSFVSAPLEITGNASWLRVADGQQTQVDLILKSNDLTAALANLNLAESLKADSGIANGQVYWDGPPTGEFLSRISGDVSIDIRDGALEEVKPGAGRLVGLLSVTQLPRRLSLDFKDVFKKGLAFDSLSGDFVLQSGQAYTNNLTLDGPAANVVLIGRTGLADRDYDQTAVVSASFGSTLPVAGALVGGPAVGAAVFALSKIFKKPLDQISQAYYRITGPWDDPTIEPITGDVEVAEATPPATP